MNKKSENRTSASKTRKPKKRKNKMKSKTKETLVAVLCFILCVVIVFSGALAILIRSKFNKMNFGDGFGGNPNATFLYEEENLNFRQMSDIENAESVKELIRSWATNGGDKLYSKNVINVLLIGEDDEGGSHRSDSTILLTINKKTRKIILTSFLRDSYTYMNIAGQGRYDKTNHAYSWGGAAKLMEVLSDNYKIRIDHFVSINYNSFISAVDELGGVSVMVTDAEADFMNRTTNMKGFESGENVRLDGEHALVFARIRKLDGEPERTERQRRLITAFINSVKSSTLSDLNKAIDKFLPFISTNYSKSEILSLGTKAITEGWLNYDIVSQVAPSEETRMGFTGYQTYTGNLDVWIVDYIKAAKELQQSLYNNTNIVINEETHVSAIDLALGSKKAYEAEEETTMDIFGYLQDITIPDIEIPSYNIDDILRPDRYYPQTEPHSGESDESTTADTVSEEYETEPTTYY